MAQLAWAGNKSGRQVTAASLVLLLLSVAGPSASQDRVRDAVPVDPITAIIEALKTHQVVAFGEAHGNAQIADVRLTLLRDPRFPDAVQDIVVEFGTPKHQDVIDKYVNGGTVTDEELERVWTDSQFPANWSNPLYKQFYRTVREVNANLAASRRIRVVLGEPTPRTMTVEAELIRREVIEKGHTALLVFGSGHFARKPPYYSISNRKLAEFIFNDPDSVSTVAHLDAAGVNVFSICALSRDALAAVQPDVASWQTPALTIVKGTRLGVEPFATFAPKDGILTLPNADGNGTHQEPAVLDPERSGLMQEQYDAVLVIDPSAK
jgi:Haem-binding uptake, Tiki superfamily, ChaN